MSSHFLLLMVSAVVAASPRSPEEVTDCLLDAQSDCGMSVSVRKRTPWMSLKQDSHHSDSMWPTYS
jgi:hypothetical protein